MAYTPWVSRKSYKIGTRGLRIGWGPGNEVPLEDGQVSQQYARGRM